VSGLVPYLVTLPPSGRRSRFRQKAYRSVILRRFPTVLLVCAAFGLAGCDQPGPGDVLSMFVYEAPPLSVSDLPVRPDGRISVPLVPDVMAAGKTPSQLGSEISDKLKKYVNDPNVTVMVHNFQGPADRQVRVIGEATDPQAIPYRENMTVLDVMIATKGLTKFAAGNRAVILRHVGGKEVRIPVHLADLIKDGDIRQNVAMRPGDTVIIPQSYF
jgi:polysaccharide export outer membrane protein